MSTARLTPRGETRLYLVFSNFSTISDVIRAGLVVLTPRGYEFTSIGYQTFFQALTLDDATVEGPPPGTVSPDIMRLHAYLIAGPQFTDFLVGNFTTLFRYRMVKSIPVTVSPQGGPVIEATAVSGINMCVLDRDDATVLPGSRVAVAYIFEPDENGKTEARAVARWFEGTVVHVGPAHSILVDFPAAGIKGPERCIVDLHEDEVVAGERGLAFIRKNPDTILLREEILFVDPGAPWRTDLRAVLYSDQTASMRRFLDDYDGLAPVLGIKPLSFRPTPSSFTIREYVDGLDRAAH